MRFNIQIGIGVILLSFGSPTTISSASGEAGVVRRPDLLSAWQQAATLDIRGAHRAFLEIEEATAANPAGLRQARYGKAVTLLSLQPRTQDNVERAEALLTGLIDQRSASDDPVTPMAQFFLGRIDEFHRTPRNPERAARIYREIYERHPHTLIGQIAILKVANIELMRDPDPDNLPETLAAWRDIASHLQQIRHIVVPTCGSILSTLAILLFIREWNDFLLPLVVLRDRDLFPLGVGLIYLDGEAVKQWGHIMAVYTVASIPLVILFLLSMRAFIRGLTSGAVKG